MITIKDFMEVANYRITEGSEYLWTCFGPNAYQMDSWNGVHGKGGHTVCMVFDTHTQTVYSLEAWDYTNDRCYRWINPDYIDAYKEECLGRNIDYDEAFDDVKFIDLELAEDILEKAQAIVEGREYDTRVQVPLDLPDDVLFQMMKLAHERDLTLNEFAEDMLRDFIKDYGQKQTA